MSNNNDRNEAGKSDEPNKDNGNQTAGKSDETSKDNGKKNGNDNNTANEKNEHIVNNENNENNTNNEKNENKTNNENNISDENNNENINDNSSSKERLNNTDNQNNKDANKNDEDFELKASDYNIYFEDDVLCRICYDDGSIEHLVVPCTCKGTMAFVHKTCLERWLAESNSSACELCHYRYNTQRATKYKACEAICKWLRYNDEDYDFPGRNVRTDIVVCCMLTPFAFIGSGLCILTADYYSNERFSKIPAARWTSISLLLMIGIVVIGYYLWVYMVVRYHGQMWYAWWQRDSIVKVIIADVNRVP